MTWYISLAYLPAILDACVLYPASIRDLLIRLSIQGLYHARWTTRIHDEWIENLLTARPDLNKNNLERTRNLMDQSVADCLVPLEGPIPDYGLPDIDDNHVLAAAVAAETSLIITYNLRDFPITITGPLGVAAVHPDTFVLSLVPENRLAVLDAAKAQRESLRNPAKTVEEYLEILINAGLTNTALEFRKYPERL